MSQKRAKLIKKELASAGYVGRVLKRAARLEKRAYAQLPAEHKAQVAKYLKKAISERKNKNGLPTPLNDNPMV